MNTNKRKQRIAALLLRNGSAIGLESPEQGEATGIAGLDECLPARGLPKGALSEILSAKGQLGTGALTLLLPMIARITHKGRRVALIDTGLGINPVALAHAGADLEKILLLQPRSAKEALWATDLCAKSKAIAMSIATLGRLRDLDIRHLQRSTEEGESSLALLRPANAAAASSAAALRLRVAPLAATPRRVRIEFLRTRGAFPPSPLTLEINNHGQTLDVRALTTPSLSALDTSAATASA